MKNEAPTQQMWKRMVAVMLVLIMLGFGSSCGSLLYINIFKGNKYATMAAEQQLSTTTIDATDITFAIVLKHQKPSRASKTSKFSHQYPIGVHGVNVYVVCLGGRWK